MSKLPSRKGLIDLTPMVRPGEVDIYVCAKCKFYFGSVSGPISLSTHFGSYSLLTNVNQYNINLPRTLTQLALYTKNDGRIVSFDEIKKLRL